MEAFDERGSSEFKKVIKAMELKTILQSVSIDLTDEQIGQLEKFIDLLITKNQELNLTSIKDRNEVIIKHVIDSLMLVPHVEMKEGTAVLDLGTGGGLPGIPLAIVYPNLQFTLVDSVGKKVKAVEEFANVLNLNNVKTLTARAEELGQDPEHREQYDRVLTRAVAPLRILIELAYPLVHLNGKMVAYKGPDYVNELAASTTAIRSLDAEQPQVRQYSLPEGMGDRTLIIIPKKHQTPSRYPRRVGVPNKRPL